MNGDGKRPARGGRAEERPRHPHVTDDTGEPRGANEPSATVAAAAGAATDGAIDVTGADDIFAAIAKKRDAIIAATAARNVHVTATAACTSEVPATRPHHAHAGAATVERAPVRPPTAGPAPTVPTQDPPAPAREETPETSPTKSAHISAAIPTGQATQDHGAAVTKPPPANVEADDPTAPPPGAGASTAPRRDPGAASARQIEAHRRARRWRNGLTILVLVAAAPAGLVWISSHMLTPSRSSLGAPPSASIAVPPLAVQLDPGDGAATHDASAAATPLVQRGPAAPLGQPISPTGITTTSIPGAPPPAGVELTAGLAGGPPVANRDDPLARAAAAIATGRDPVAALRDPRNAGAAPAPTAVASASTVPTAVATDGAVPAATGDPAAELRRDPLFALRDRAEAGDVRAQYDLGLHLLRGGVVTQDDAAAARWLEAAAKAGHAAAQYNLGVLYDQGRGVDQSAAEAAQWFRRSAERGNPKGQYALGVSYARGRGVDADTLRAQRLFEDAAEQGLAEAMYALGVFREQGVNGKQDLTAALEWFQKAARAGHTEAANIAAELAAELDNR